MELIAERYAATLELGGLAVLVVIAVALPVGVYSAVRRGSSLDYVARGFAALGQAVPPFWLGLVLVLIFGVLLHWLPTSGRGHAAPPPLARSHARLVRGGGPDAADALLDARRAGKRVREAGPHQGAARAHRDLEARLQERGAPGRDVRRAPLRPRCSTGRSSWKRCSAGRGWASSSWRRWTPATTRSSRRWSWSLSAMYIGINLVVDVLYAYLNPKILGTPNDPDHVHRGDGRPRRSRPAHPRSPRAADDPAGHRAGAARVRHLRTAARPPLSGGGIAGLPPRGAHRARGLQARSPGPGPTVSGATR